MQQHIKGFQIHEIETQKPTFHSKAVACCQADGIDLIPALEHFRNARHIRDEMGMWIEIGELDSAGYHHLADFLQSQMSTYKFSGRASVYAD